MTHLCPFCKENETPESKPVCQDCMSPGGLADNYLRRLDKSFFNTQFGIVGNINYTNALGAQSSWERE
jgi:hypothetical protein